MASRERHVELELACAGCGTTDAIVRVIMSPGDWWLCSRCYRGHGMLRPIESTKRKHEPKF